MAAIFPALMLIMLGLIQAGIWLHARNAAAQAANAAADVARSYHGAPDAARRAAERIGRVGGLEDLAVTVAQNGNEVQVTVTAQPPMIFDIGLRDIRETATAPLERVTRP